jgi:hypothetical protein
MTSIKRLSIQLLCCFLFLTGGGAPALPGARNASCGLTEFAAQITRYKAGLGGLELVTRWPDQATTSTFISPTSLFQEIESFGAGQSEGIERTVQTDFYRYVEMEAIGGGTQIKISLDELGPLETLDLFIRILTGSCISEFSFEGGTKYKIARDRLSKLPSRSGDEVGEMSVLSLPSNSPVPWSLGVSAPFCRAADLVSGPHANLPVCAEGLPFDHN